MTGSHRRMIRVVCERFLAGESIRALAKDYTAYESEIQAWLRMALQHRPERQWCDREVPS